MIVSLTDTETCEALERVTRRRAPPPPPPDPPVEEDNTWLIGLILLLIAVSPAALFWLVVGVAF